MSFYITPVQEKGWEKYVLGNTLSGTEIEIMPSAGAILNSFRITSNGHAMNVIDGYSGEEEFRTNLDKGFRSAKLSPFACRIKDARFTWKGKEYHLNKFLLNGSALHGLLYDAPFSVVFQEAGATWATLGLGYEFPGTDPGYPFRYHCHVIYLLEIENKLTVTTIITNLSNTDIPIVDGWHPYFTFGGGINELYLQICSEEMLEYDDGLVPTGKMIRSADFSTLRKIGDVHLDNGFLLDFNRSQPLCILKDETMNIRLEIYPDNSYPFLQVYTPDHRLSIAIENLSAAPDAFNNGMGLVVLGPGESKKFMTTYRVSF